MFLLSRFRSYLNSVFAAALVLSALLPILSTHAQAAPQAASLVNLDLATIPSFAARARRLEWVLGNGNLNAPLDGMNTVIMQANGDISAAQARRLGEWVRQGGALLLTLSENPGPGPFRLSFMLPTTAWQTVTNLPLGECSVGEEDAAFYGVPTVAAPFTVPFHFKLQPFEATERGEARYERFERAIPYLGPERGMHVAAGNDFWTRPLLNRDWRIWARSDDGSQSPLLLTGRYGAGRVAVFASSLQGVEQSPGADAFWTPVLHWLSARDAARSASPPTLQLPAPQTTIDTATRTLRAQLHNPSQAPLEAQVVGRLLTWEGALIGDVDSTATIPAGGTTTVALPLPQPSVTQYQALNYRDAFVMRLGVLSADGATLLAETRLPIDLRPPVSLTVATDDLRATPYPFAAPSPDIENRLGLPLMAYAYKPGQTINAHITIANGAHNIAPLARVRDEAAPDNQSVMALNDEAVYSEKGPIDGITAFGTWDGAAKQEHVLAFEFPHTVTVSAVTLIGAPDNYRNYLRYNPPAATIEVDGKTVAHADDLATRFPAEKGLVRLAFAPTQGTVVRVRLPWLTGQDPQTGRDRNQAGVRLGEIAIEGITGASLPAPTQGTVTLVLRNALDDTATPIATRPVTVAPLERAAFNFQVMIPTGVAAQFYRLEASFDGQTTGAPFMALPAPHPLQPITAVRPDNAPSLGFIVTRGFRSVFDTGTGTAEMSPSWAQPDDLIWAYAHQLKQIGAHAHTHANRLYLSEDDMRHYATPWRDFDNGEYFYDVAAPILVERMKQDSHWANANTAILAHSDRWDTGPQVGSLNGWQDFEGFNAYLLAHGKAGLAGRTREELVTEIHATHESEWQAWNLARYVGAVRELREDFAKGGKRLVITAQGVPLVPTAYAAELTQTIRGMSDDSTWGMMENNIPLTTGRQMATLAFDPGWAMSTLSQWGYNSSVLENQHWHAPVGTTEPSRRHFYDRAFRGVIRPNGTYTSMHAYGYNSNAGYSFTMTPNDWQEWLRTQDKHSLLTPEAPLGAGLVISTSQLDDPQHVAFSGNGELSAGLGDVWAVIRATQHLHEAGVSLPFSTNASTLDKWRGNAPLILLNLTHYSDTQIATLEKLNARGVRLAAFIGDGKLSPRAAALFGVTPEGSLAGGLKVGAITAHPIVAYHDRLLIPLAAENLTGAEARTIAPLLQDALQLPITFPQGTAGYGFVSNGRRFIVVEDWREEGRTVILRLRVTPGMNSLHAASTNDHRALITRRAGADWLIEVPLRPGDGELVAVEERQ